jgi:hypothetical protein
MKVNLPNKTLLVVTGENQEKMFEALKNSTVPADVLKVFDLLKKSVSWSVPALKKYQLPHMILNHKLVHDNCVNNMISGHIMSQQEKLLDSAFDVLMLVGGMKTIGQVNFLLDQTKFQFQRVILLVGIDSRFDNDEYYQNILDSMSEYFDIFYFEDPWRYENEVEKIIKKMKLPVIMPSETVGFFKKNMNPTLHLIHK